MFKSMALWLYLGLLLYFSESARLIVYKSHIVLHFLIACFTKNMRSKSEGFS